MKYQNKATSVDGVKFDSKLESRRWGELQLLERAGQIRGLERQVRYELAPSVKFAGSPRAKPALCYWADFRYWAGDDMVIEDAKGIVTDAYRIKKHLMKSVHGLEIVEISKKKR